MTTALSTVHSGQLGFSLFKQSRMKLVLHLTVTFRVGATTYLWASARSWLLRGRLWGIVNCLSWMKVCFRLSILGWFSSSNHFCLFAATSAIGTFEKAFSYHALVSHDCLDHKTDSIIQSSLRNELGSDVTILTIAHRLQTIMDADKIVIIYASPANLNSYWEIYVDGLGQRTHRKLRSFLLSPIIDSYLFIRSSSIRHWTSYRRRAESLRLSSMAAGTKRPFTPWPSIKPAAAGPVLVRSLNTFILTIYISFFIIYPCVLFS